MAKFKYKGIEVSVINGIADNGEIKFGYYLSKLNPRAHHPGEPTFEFLKTSGHIYKNREVAEVAARQHIDKLLETDAPGCC